MYMGGSQRHRCPIITFSTMSTRLVLVGTEQVGSWLAVSFLATFSFTIGFEPTTD